MLQVHPLSPHELRDSVPAWGTNHICGDFFCSQKSVCRKCGNFFFVGPHFLFGTLSRASIGKHAASRTDILSRPQGCPPPNSVLPYVVPVRGLLVFCASITQQNPHFIQFSPKPVPFLVACASSWVGIWIANVPSLQPRRPLSSVAILFYLATVKKISPTHWALARGHFNSG
jgi:hypothetical protein